MLRTALFVMRILLCLKNQSAKLLKFHLRKCFYRFWNIGVLYNECKRIFQVFLYPQWLPILTFTTIPDLTASAKILVAVADETLSRVCTSLFVIYSLHFKYSHIISIRDFFFGTRTPSASFKNGQKPAEKQHRPPERQSVRNRLRQLQEEGKQNAQSKQRKKSQDRDR